MEQAIQIPREVVVLCDLLDITPLELVTQLMRDLCSMPGSGGTDERVAAKTWLLLSPLSRATAFSSEEATTLLQEFETLFISARPATDNPGWEQARTEMIDELQAKWQERKQPNSTTA